MYTMYTKNLLLITCLLSCLKLFYCQEVCLKSVDSYEKHLGSKSPYRVIANQNSSQIKYEGCHPVKLWALVRHGTRNPNVKLMERMRTRSVEIRNEILENIQEANDYIHNTDLDLFRKWTSKLGDQDEKKLTHEGEDEMLALAERMQSRFPEVLGTIYSQSAYKFKFTATQRTKKSAQYFAAGLFGRNTVRSIYYPEALKQDPILRFYKLCKKWRKEISKNPETVIERRKFESSKIMEETVREINQRLGFKNGELNLTDVHTMYMTCAFETAWNKRKRSPWCSIFSLDNLKVMEYAEELKHYWVDGYGHELTYKQACPAFNDMIDSFQSEDNLSKATVYFTHSGTLLKMLAHLELYKDDKHLTADNFDDNHNRKWRISRIDTFGTNLFFILFDCDGEKKVLTLHQENIVRLPSCPDSDLCDLKKMVKYYNDSIESCFFDEMCDN